MRIRTQSCIIGDNSIPFFWLGQDDKRSRSAWDGTLGICCRCSLQAAFPNSPMHHVLVLRALRDAKFVVINQLSFSDITHSTT